MHVPRLVVATDGWVDSESSVPYKRTHLRPVAGRSAIDEAGAHVGRLSHRSAGSGVSGRPQLLGFFDGSQPWPFSGRQMPLATQREFCGMPCYVRARGGRFHTPLQLPAVNSTEKRRCRRRSALALGRLSVLSTIGSLVHSCTIADRIDGLLRSLAMLAGRFFPPYKGTRRSKASVGRVPASCPHEQCCSSIVLAATYHRRVCAQQPRKGRSIANGRTEFPSTSHASAPTLLAQPPQRAAVRMNLVRHLAPCSHVLPCPWCR